MKRYAIFDLDGTLLDSSRMWQNLGERYLKLLGIKPDDDLAEAMYVMTMPQSANYLRERYAIPYSVDEIIRQLTRMTEDFYKEQVEFRIGAPLLLAQLRARCVKMSIATAGDAALGMIALDRLGVSNFFAGAVSCTEYGAKTSAEVFLAAAELIYAVPEETVVFEDSLHAVRSAKKAGFRTAAVRDISERDQDELKRTADFYARTPEDLVCMLSDILA